MPVYASYILHFFSSIWIHLVRSSLCVRSYCVRMPLPNDSWHWVTCFASCNGGTARIAAIWQIFSVLGKTAPNHWMQEGQPAEHFEILDFAEKMVINAWTSTCQTQFSLYDLCIMVWWYGSKKGKLGVATCNFQFSTCAVRSVIRCYFLIQFFQSSFLPLQLMLWHWPLNRVKVGGVTTIKMLWDLYGFLKARWFGSAWRFTEGSIEAAGRCSKVRVILWYDWRSRALPTLRDRFWLLWHLLLRASPPWAIAV